MSGGREIPTRRTLRMSSQPRSDAIRRASPLLLAQTVAFSVCPSLSMYLTMYLCNLSASPFLRSPLCRDISDPTGFDKTSIPLFDFDFRLRQKRECASPRRVCMGIATQVRYVRSCRHLIPHILP